MAREPFGITHLNHLRKHFSSIVCIFTGDPPYHSGRKPLAAQVAFNAIRESVEAYRFGPL